MRLNTYTAILVISVISFLSFSNSAQAASPVVGTITPISGTSNPNDTVTFTTTYTDLDGWTNILYANLLINTSTNGANCFYGYYNQNTNRLYLRNDENTRWLGGYAPGSRNTIENSYVRLNCAGTRAVGLRGTLTVVWSITFKSSFAGAKACYLYVMDDTKLHNGWAKKGKWTIRNRTPSVGTINPIEGSSAIDIPVSFATTYTDPDGWLNIQYTNLLINTSTSTTNCFYGYYNQNTNKLYLRNDANRRWLGGYNPGTANVIENSYTRLNCASTTVSGSGTTLTVNWNISFKSSFAGTKNTYLYVKDDANSYNGFTQTGTWLIDATPPVGTITINSGADYTNNTQITLTLSAEDPETGVTEMEFSKDNVEWSTPLPYSTTREWTLDPENGIKTMYVKYKNSVGMWSDAVSDTIILDTIPPEMEITIPDDGYVTRQDVVKVWGTLNEEAEVNVNENSALMGNNQFTVDEIPLQNGENTIIVTATDLAGNIGSRSIAVNLNNLVQAEILIDDFTDIQQNTNNAGFWTGDNQSCVENIDLEGHHKLSWSTNSAYWYSDLWDNVTLPAGTDISYYERLTFRIKGENGGENFSVELADIPNGTDFNKSVEINNYINITNEWQEVTIPIKDFTVQGIWKTNIRSIVFNFDKVSSGTIYVDDLKLKPCLIDTFADSNPDANSLGYITGDGATLVENNDINGCHKFQWDSVEDYWQTDLWDANCEFNASGFKYIYIRLYGESGGENISLELEDNVTISSVEISDLDRSWGQIYIPLSDFAVDKSKLRSITIRFNRIPAGTIYIDKMGIANINGSALIKPQSTGSVKIIGKQLVVNNIPFIVKGIVYQPTPVGTVPAMNSALYQDSNIYNRDLPLLRELGCNTIRIFKKLNSHDFLNACYNGGVNPIYVIMGFTIDYNDLSNPDVRDFIKQEFREYVREYKDEPAVLLWALGNEINLTYTGDIRDWYSLANELAGIAYEVEGEQYHPVLIVNRDIEDIGDDDSFGADDLLNYIDLWGINAYRGLSYEGFFECYSQISAKPMLVTEYGADSWYSSIMPDLGYADPHTQAKYYLNNWNEIKNNVGCIGGALMEYSDEWWKVAGGNYDVQDYGGFSPRYDQPDNYSNEEFWGLFSVQDNGENPNILIPKKAHEVMKLGFNNLPYPEMVFAWEFNTDGDPEGWTVSGSLSDFAVGSGLLQTEAVGSNPNMDSPNELSINGLLYSGIEIRLRVDNGSIGRLFWKKEGEAEFSDENNQEFLLFRNGEFHTYYIYLGNNPNWNGIITQLRLNPTNASNGAIDIDYIRIMQGSLPEDFTPPENITSLTADSGNEEVILNWAASLDSAGDLSDQFLYINDSEPISLGPLTTTYTATGLINGITYTFRMTCVDSVLNENTSAAVQATPRDITVPEDITNLTAIPGDSAITLNWSISINGEGDLEGQNLYIDDVYAERLGPLTTSYTINGLNNGQLYRFRITCVDEVPNESSGITIQAIPQPAGAPLVEITNPIDGFITGDSTITVFGTTNNNSAVITVNGVPAVIDSGIFTANNVSLLNEEGNQLIAAAVYDGNTGNSVITVYRDTTPPELEITTPRDGEKVTGYE